MKSGKLIAKLKYSLVILVLICCFTVRDVDAISSINGIISIDSSGTASNEPSTLGVMSRDGGVITFVSLASNLVVGDTNGKHDVFVKNVSTGATTRASVSSSGVQGNNTSSGPLLTKDGQKVLFYSSATNLVPSDTNAKMDLFMHNLLTGTTERLSVSTTGVQSNGDSGSWGYDISQDNRFVVFASSGNNLVSGDTNGSGDIFIKDLKSGVVQRISLTDTGAEANSHSTYPSMDCSSRYILFASQATNLVAGDTNGFVDNYLYDRLTGELRNITMNANGPSNAGLISCDGNFVVFRSDASNLVSGDTNGMPDIFRYNVQEETIERINVDLYGNQSASSASLQRVNSVSDDGRFVVFNSIASDLVASDMNMIDDVFIKDMNTGYLERISVNNSGIEGNGVSQMASVSGSGNLVVFSSQATNLVNGDGNNKTDVFLAATGQSTCQ